MGEIHTQALCRANSFLIDLSKLRKTYVLIGNHDRINNNVFLTDEHPFTGLKGETNIVIVDKVFSENGIVLFRMFLMVDFKKL